MHQMEQQAFASTENAEFNTMDVKVQQSAATACFFESIRYDVNASSIDKVADCPCTCLDRSARAQSQA